MQRNNNWFVPGDGIAREVITADIQRYLGPDALVRPGEHQGRQGYWITAYRTLTSQMIQDLRTDSQRWEAERRGAAGQSGPIGDYSSSQTHASRQYHGPTEPVTAQQQRAPAYPPQGAYEQGNYAITAGYGQHPTYQTHQGQPRTTYQDQYAQQAGQRADYTYSYQQTPGYAAPPAQTDTYGTPAGQYQAAAQRVARPGYYIASDGREYPLPQQQQQQQQQQQPQQPQQHNPRRRA